MRLSDAMVRLRELLRAQDTAFFTDLALGGHLNRQQVSLCRRMVEIDEAYFNHTFILPVSSARQVASSMWSYTLPPWTVKVVQVRESVAPEATASLGNLLPYVGKHDNTRGWRYDGMNTLRLVGFGTAIALSVTVAKRPAMVTKGTLPTQANLAAGNTELRLDLDNSADALAFPHETLTNSYANAIVEITGANARSGQLLRATGSTHFVDEGGSRFTELTMESAWVAAPQSGDTYEMHFELPDHHMDILLLLAAYRAWGAVGHAAEQKAMAAELQMQMRDFENSIRPRQTQMPMRLQTSTLPAYAELRTNDTREKLWD